MKTMTIVGTRPEIIRLSSIIKVLDKYTNHTLVHTGQNWDINLSQVFFEDLDLRMPDIMLECKSDTLHGQISNIIRETGNVLDQVKPDCLIVLGDTNSCLSVINAQRKKIPIFHLEAGDRSFDNDVPEELNRRIVDHTSDVNLAYTEHSRRNLLREGIHPDNIYVIGSPIKEVYETLDTKISKCDILTKLNLEQGKYIVASLHREENVDKPGAITKIVQIFNKIVDKYKVRIIVSTHPRTMKRLKDEELEQKCDKRIEWHQPFGLINYIKLQLQSLFVISDSGTIHEDSAILGFAAIALRKSTEKKESLESGFCPIAGLEIDSVMEAIEMILDTKYTLKLKKLPSAYGESAVSYKVVQLILGLTSIVQANQNKQVR